MTVLENNRTAPFTLRIEQELLIQHEQEKSYPEITFQVPDQVEKIEVCYRYPKNEQTVVDIGLRSPERLIGWSGGARERFFVGLEKATPGYLAGPLKPGQWSVMLGAYRIPEEGCRVSVEILLTLQHERWLKGDLHAHTRHSDGSYTPEQAMELSLGKGLDYLALTDHNTASQNRFAHAGHEELLLIPGVELTSYKGHANLLGHPDSLEDFRVLTREQAAAQLEKARDKGALISLNHPFDESCPWEFGFDVPYDAVEVWNGPWRELNETAVRWWQEQLAQGQRIVAVGGSDVHRTEAYMSHGTPTAYVLAGSETAGAIIEGIRRGAVVISMEANETFMDFRAGQTRVGGTVTAVEGEEVTFEIQIRGAVQDRIGLWSDRGLEQEWNVEHKQDIVLNLPGDRLFYRLEARRFLPEHNIEVMSCLTNPIYLERQGASS
ncbi:hypothetical protein AWM70_09585 [Paenibacillus yonginensis]|uniref:Polymerase/histidinol phosphatase N-terminal domain-containing protein n=1 Tax=Paenibacillus yonginensis TaxID=1462996 RepID=A0A1B1N061_9BACL|nr:CehA/McbA family metallohydrolase [Paenibacillus yonginensis]ANS74813.1 hypothetical protein AWM70_09585 [Paenibacillus yonginensis]